MSEVEPRIPTPADGENVTQQADSETIQADEQTDEPTSGHEESAATAVESEAVADHVEDSTEPDAAPAAEASEEAANVVVDEKTAPSAPATPSKPKITAKPTVNTKPAKPTKPAGGPTTPLVKKARFHFPRFVSRWMLTYILHTDSWFWHVWACSCTCCPTRSWFMI